MSGVKGLDADLLLEVRKAPVVIFRSPLTDIRVLTGWLRAHGVPWHEVILGMGAAGERQRFERLQRATGWYGLPQVFVEGMFVGGINEFLDHAFVAGRTGLPPRARRVARALGYAGLLPFAAGALVAWSPLALFWQLAALHALLVYAAVVLTFLGAVHWGYLLGEPAGAASPRRRLVGGIVPSLVGWSATLTAAPVALPVLGAGLVGAYLYDRRQFAGVSAVRWYLVLRRQLTAGAVASLAVAWLAVMTALGV